MSIDLGKAKKILSEAFVSNHEEINEDAAAGLVFRVRPIGSRRWHILTSQTGYAISTDCSRIWPRAGPVGIPQDGNREWAKLQDELNRSRTADGAVFAERAHGTEIDRRGVHNLNDQVRQYASFRAVGIQAYADDLEGKQTPANSKAGPQSV